MGSDLKLPWLGSPAWPDFRVYQVDGGTWEASTDTGRPRTPIFTAWLGRQPDEETARIEARTRLDEMYAKAHPNGCPGGH